MTEQNTVTLTAERWFEVIGEEPVDLRDVENLIATVRNETEGAMFAAVIASKNEYWRGWSDALIGQRSRYGVLSNRDFSVEHLYSEEVSRISFASPFNIETLVKVPAALVSEVRRMFALVFERLYLPDETRLGKQIENVHSLQLARSVQLDNLAKALDLAERIPDEQEREAVFRHVSLMLRDAHPEILSATETRPIRRFREVRGEIRDAS